MKWWTIPEEFPDIPDDTNRTHGVCHLSDVLGSMAADLFNLQYTGTERLEEKKLQYEKGFVWERALEKAYGEQFASRPGEFNLDGIYCSPDGVNFIGMEVPAVGLRDVMVVEEYKCTAFSSNKTPDDPGYWKYVAQIKAYCHVLGCEYAILRIFHVRGDYKTNVPAYKVYGFQFTERELKEHWQAILNHARMKGMVK